MDRSHQDMMSHLRKQNRDYRREEMGGEQLSKGNRVGMGEVNEHRDGRETVSMEGDTAASMSGEGVSEHTGKREDSSREGVNGECVTGGTEGGSAGSASGEHASGVVLAEDSVKSEGARTEGGSAEGVGAEGVSTEGVSGTVKEEMLAQGDFANVDEDRRELRGYISEENIKHVELTDEERTYYLNITTESLSFGKSVTEQNEKTEALYLGFSQSLGLPPYPVTVTLGVGFLVYLAKSKQYCYNTLSTVTYQSLARLNVVRTGSEIALSVREAMRRKLAEIRISPDTKQGRGGMEPLILDDLKRVISTIKDIDPLKPRLASLFLFGLFTGARANSCAHVRFCDFHAFRDYGGGKYTVRVYLEHVKGNSGKVFELSVGGNPDVRKDTDFLYWMNIVFLDRVGIGIRDYCDSNTVEKTSKKFKEVVWGWNEDNMTQHLKSRLRNAGFPTKQLGFHSLRAGFLASVIMYNLQRDGSMDGVLTKSALVAGWKAYSDVQDGYFKLATRALMVGSDLVGATLTPKRSQPAATDSDVPIPGTQLSTYDFHNWERCDPPPDTRSYTFVVKSAFVKRVNEYIGKPISKIRGNSLWATALVRYGSVIIATKGEEGEEIVRKFSGTRWNCMRQIAGRAINYDISRDAGVVERIAGELFEMVKSTGRLSEPVSSDEEHSGSGTERKKTLSTVRRIWSKEEDDLLVNMIKDGYTSIQMAEHLEGRSSTAVAAHVKVLNERRARDGLELLQLSPSRKTHTSSLNFQPQTVATKSTQATADQSESQSINSVSPSASSQNTLTPPFPVFTTVPYHPQSLPSSFSFSVIEYNPTRDATATPPLSEIPHNSLNSNNQMEHSSSPSIETPSQQSRPSVHQECVTTNPPKDCSPDPIELSQSSPTPAVRESNLQMKQKAEPSSAIPVDPLVAASPVAG